ncbi:PREDICTED: uncharacterized protein LOC104732424 [Camelina sativa]|uniref:Uncharacterized protein LOC104732424 n=1 Tax=Camelina sativa TaxID=90675 RepID=A0ABM0V3M8_CAMSA|nr:PREDICTED: uncharacterized protein LOC104732424 [Camelina sativa]
MFTHESSVKSKTLMLHGLRMLSKPMLSDFTVQASSPQVAAVSAPRSRDRSSLLCTHCHRQGHEVTECFLVHGYPDWWLEQNRHDGSTNSTGRGSSGRGSSGRGNRGRGNSSSGSRGRGRANAVSTRSNTSTTNDAPDPITHLISLLQAHRPNTSSEKLSDRLRGL